MFKTTLYLPEELKKALERRAAEEGLSEAALIRRALQQEVGDASPVRPRVPLFEVDLGDPNLAERVDELLEGFGES
jgi:plasmid stability protein